jgi:hypothetical protein
MSMTRSTWNLQWIVLAAVAAGCAGQAGVGTTSRSLYVTENPETPTPFANAIMSGNVVVGMTPSMVIAAWGKPTRIEKTAANPKGDEKWIYGNYLVNNAVTHLYFRTGALVLYEFVDTQSQMTQSISDPNQKLILQSQPKAEDGGSKNPN